MGVPLTFPFLPNLTPFSSYVPGSIVRVQLHNFLTYDHVEFRPGPHLNMIIGPNGTGKSSIACAIALGLNWPPSVRCLRMPLFPVAHFEATKILGRAAELNSFVKIGATDGYIEIELKGKIGKNNLIVRRNLSSTSKGSTYSLNSQAATGREVTQKMNDLNVQVGNLWYVSTQPWDDSLTWGLPSVLSYLKIRSPSSPTCHRSSSCARHSVPLATLA